MSQVHEIISDKKIFLQTCDCLSCEVQAPHVVETQLVAQEACTIIKLPLRFGVRVLHVWGMPLQRKRIFGASEVGFVTLWVLWVDLCR